MIQAYSPARLQNYAEARRQCTSKELMKTELWILRQAQLFKSFGWRSSGHWRERVLCWINDLIEQLKTLLFNLLEVTVAKCKSDTGMLGSAQLVLDQAFIRYLIIAQTIVQRSVMID